MIEILDYFNNLIIIMVFFIPIYLLIRCRVLKVKSIKLEVLSFIFFIYIFSLTILAITPKFIIDSSGIHIIESGNSYFNIIPFRMLYDFYIDFFTNHSNRYLLINILGNIIMFIPIGLFLPIFFNLSYKKLLLIGICYSLFIEVFQIFLPRVSDIDDIILNNIGVSIGFLFNKFLKRL